MYDTKKTHKEDEKRRIWKNWDPKSGSNEEKNVVKKKRRRERV